MTTINFNTVNELSNVPCENKSAKYLEMAREFAIKAQEMSKDNESFISKKYAQEAVMAMRRAESADCEYALYVAANAAEKWFEKCWNNLD